MSEAKFDGGASRVAKILIVDDDPDVRAALKDGLRPYRNEWSATSVESVDEALKVVASDACDVVVSDFHMPGRDGFDLLRSLRSRPSTADLPVVIVTGALEHDLKRRALELGATDLLTKPIQLVDLVARLRSVLKLKRCQDDLRDRNAALEGLVRLRTADLERAKIELIWRLGKASEFRDRETGWHVVRVGYFARTLAEALGADSRTANMLFHTAPLHDVGKIGIPDRILLKPGKLTPEEWDVMRTHTTQGAEILRADVLRGVVDENPELAMPAIGKATGEMLEMAADIAHYHHERWDGTGYPVGLVHDKIPLAARITSVADVFDALSSRRPYKPAFDESEVLAMMRKGSGTQFDPAIVDAFERKLAVFRDIRERFQDVEEPEVQEDTAISVLELHDA
jgi:putative two-component system response regulator